MKERQKRINTKIQMWGAWCGPLYVILLALGWWIIAAYMPPHSPAAMAGEIAEIYRQNALQIRIGMVLTMFAAALYIPFTATLADQIARIEGRVGILTMCQVMGGMGNAVLTFYPAIWWLIATFRPERSDDLIYLLNDAAWLQFVGGLTLFLPVLVSIAIAAFMDESETPMFPRWAGYLNLWFLVLFLPGQLIFFFKTGPFAWNGILAFWVPLTIFFGWFAVMFVLLRTGIMRQARSA